MKAHATKQLLAEWSLILGLVLACTLLGAVFMNVMELIGAAT